MYISLYMIYMTRDIYVRVYIYIHKKPMYDIYVCI